MNSATAICVSMLLNVLYCGSAADFPSGMLRSA